MKGAREEKLKEIFTFYVSASNFLKRSLLLKRITILIVKKPTSLVQGSHLVTEVKEGPCLTTQIEQANGPRTPAPDSPTQCCPPQRFKERINLPQGFLLLILFQ